VSGKANLPFLQNDDAMNDDENFVVTDPYLEDDIFRNEKKAFA